jgi:membrane associated rhomboid family serine protease
MSSGADLFVVCRQCGSEVSPYITECPYCGHRLRRRAPKLPRLGADLPTPRARSQRRSILARLRVGSTPARRRGDRRPLAAGWSQLRPHATIGLVAVSCAGWIAWHAEPLAYEEMVIFGPLHGDWWRIFTSELVYANGFYAFLTLVTIAIFGWLIEQRHGALVVLALFFGAGSLGALAAVAAYPDPIVSGGNAAALALLAAWAVPDLLAARARSYYEGDLLAAGALAALILAIPYAYPEASWLAGLSGAVIGLVAGLGLRRGSAGSL